MDLKLLAKQINKAVKESCKDYRSIKGPHGYPTGWHFLTADDVVGFVALDDGSVTGLEPSIAVCLVVDSADDYDREDLMHLLGVNFCLTDAAISILPSSVETSDSIIIIFQKRTPDAFRAGDFADIVNHLVEQREIMFTPQDEDEDEDFEEDEEDDEHYEEDEEDCEDVCSVIESLFLDEDEDLNRDLRKQGRGQKRKK